MQAPLKFTRRCWRSRCCWICLLPHEKGLKKREDFDTWKLHSSITAKCELTGWWNFHRWLFHCKLLARELVTRESWSHSPVTVGVLFHSRGCLYPCSSFYFQECLLRTPHSLSFALADRTPESTSAGAEMWKGKVSATPLSWKFTVSISLHFTVSAFECCSAAYLLHPPPSSSRLSCPVSCLLYSALSILSYLSSAQVTTGATADATAFVPSCCRCCCCCSCCCCCFHCECLCCGIKSRFCFFFLPTSLSLSLSLSLSTLLFLHQWPEAGFSNWSMIQWPDWLEFCFVLGFSLLLLCFFFSSLTTKRNIGPHLYFSLFFLFLGSLFATVKETTHNTH